MKWDEKRFSLKTSDELKRLHVMVIVIGPSIFMLNDEQLRTNDYFLLHSHSELAPYILTKKIDDI